jgi:hypothetical protein
MEHPWMTFFLGLAVVQGAVTITRGYAPPMTVRSRERGTYECNP